MANVFRAFIQVAYDDTLIGKRRFSALDYVLKMGNSA